MPWECYEQHPHDLRLHPPSPESLNPTVSHIAIALAKSKGKAVPPPSPEGDSAVSRLRIGPSAKPVLSQPTARMAPLSVITPATAPATPPLPARIPSTAIPAASVTAPKWGILIAVTFLIVVIVAASAWLLLKKDNAFALPTPPPLATTITPATVTPPTPAATLAKPAKVVLEAPLSTPSPALAEKVRLLPITGAAGGGSQRLSVSGKIFEPGDTVIEGLILQSIENAEIVFRDPEGNLYTRRL